MLEPTQQKYRKQQRGRLKGVDHTSSTLAFGDFGIKALEPHWITARQIEAARIVIARHLQETGRFWIRIFPDKPVTKTPAETRMGKGKGDVDHYVAVVKPGRIMFEIGGVDEELGEEALHQAGHKLPIRTKVVTREFH
jgi:large subunit ribosomal protein L16